MEGHPGSLADEDKDNAGKAYQVWAKPQAGGAMAVLLVARALDQLSARPIDLSLRLSNFVPAGKVAVRDIWRQKELGQHSGTLVFPAVAPHDSVFLLLTPS